MYCNGWRVIRCLPTQYCPYIISAMKTKQNKTKGNETWKWLKKMLIGFCGQNGIASNGERHQTKYQLQISTMKNIYYTYIDQHICRWNGQESYCCRINYIMFEYSTWILIKINFHDPNTVLFRESEFLFEVVNTFTCLKTRKYHKKKQTISLRHQNLSIFHLHTTHFVDA